MVWNGLFAAEGTVVQDTALRNTTNGADSPTSLIIAGVVLLVIVLIGLPILATCVQRMQKASGQSDSVPLKGLGLPQGSIRGMLALLTVGALVVVATFGGPALGLDYERVLTTLATLAGPVLGFYFGSRGSGGAAPMPKGESADRTVGRQPPQPPVTAGRVRPPDTPAESPARVANGTDD